MTGPRPSDPPFDPLWLDTLADLCRSLTVTTPRFVDLFLERRMELRVASVSGDLQAEESRSEGAAVRWKFPARTALYARTGTSPAALDDLLSRHSRHSVVPRNRPMLPVEIDPPRGWRVWAGEALRQASSGHGVVRFMARQAVVVRPGEWSVAKSPPLVRVEVNGHAPASLLSVWGHPKLGVWLGELFDDPQSRRWRPDSGLQLPTVFTSGTAGVLLHETVGHLVESDLVSAGDSPLSTQFGANITNSAIDIVDDPTRRDLPGAFSCDDEGEIAKPVHLVSDGRLVGWLSDRSGAGALGVSGGRGRRASWDRPPVARMSNLTVPRGSVEPGLMERDLQNGLVVSRVGGATVDPNSGRIVLRVERGWEIRRGRRRRATEAFELTGSVLDVLANIDPAIGSDPTPDWRLGWCVKDGIPLPTGSEVPSMLIHKLEVL